MNLENIDTEKWLELAVEYGLKVLGAIVIWIIGSWVIKKLLSEIITKQHVINGDAYNNRMEES